MSKLQTTFMQDLPAIPLWYNGMWSMVNTQVLDELAVRDRPAVHADLLAELLPDDEHRHAHASPPAEHVSSGAQNGDRATPLPARDREGCCLVGARVTARQASPMTRYLARKILIYLVTFWVAVTIDWAIPRLMPGDPIQRLLSRMQAQPSSAGGADRLLHEGVRLRRPGLEAVPQLLGGALPRRPRPQHRELPDAGLRADHGRAAVHARAARPGGPAQLLGREQGRRARRAPQVARQHGAAGRLRADRDAADVARDRARRGSSRSTLGWFPVSGAYSLALQPAWSLEFAGSFLYHWILPVLGALPRRLRRLGDRDAEHDHLRARGRLLELPRRARRADRSSCASTPTGTRCCRRSPASRSRSARSSPARSWSRSSSRTPGLGTLTLTRDPEPRLLPDPGDLPLPDHRRADREPRSSTSPTSSSTRARASGCRAARRWRRRRREAELGPRRRPSSLDDRRRRAPSPAAPPAPAHRSEFLYFALRNWKFVFGSSLVLVAARCSRSSGRCSPTHPPLAFTGPTDQRAVGGVLVRHDLVRPGRLLAVRPRPARRVPRRRGRRRDRVGARRGRRLHRRLPRRLGRRRAEHAHERRARDPDAGDPDHRRRLPERAQLRHGGGADRPHLVAVGGAGGARADLLAEDARLRRHRAAHRPQHAADHHHARSRRT